jgi:hypothetical protein
VVLIALHIFMVETAGQHAHTPPVPASDHATIGVVVYDDMAGDQRIAPMASWTSTEALAKSALACLAILAGFVLVRVLRGAESTQSVVPMALRPVAPGPTPPTPPPVAHGILRI